LRGLDQAIAGKFALLDEREVMQGLSEWLKAQRSAGVTVNMDFFYSAKEVEQFDEGFSRPRKAQLSLPIDALRNTVENAQSAVHTAREALCSLKNSNAMIEFAKKCQDDKLYNVEAQLQVTNVELTSNLERMKQELRLTGGMAMTSYLKDVFRRTQDVKVSQVVDDTLGDLQTDFYARGFEDTLEDMAEKKLRKLSRELLLAKTGYDMEGWKGFAALRTEEGWKGFLQVKITAIKKKRSHLTRDE
jgi:hypothetical protein